MPAGKCWCYVIFGIVIHVLIILIFVLIVMPIRNPKLKLHSADVENLNLHPPHSPSFTMKLVAQVLITNTNFGHYTFKASNVIVSYKGNEIGREIIDEGHVRARSKKVVNVVLTLNSENSGRSKSLISDINSGRIRLGAYLSLTGKVHLSTVVKKKKSAQMNCAMDVNTRSIRIQNLLCK